MTPQKRLLTGSSSLSDFSRVPRDPGTIGAWILSNVGVTAAATTFAAIAVGYIATTIVTAWLTSALSPKPQRGGDFGVRGTLFNSREAVAPQEYVYGTVRKGGSITYIEATGTNNQYLHMIICLAGHEVSSIGNVYINDDVVTLDANGFVTSQNWNSKIRIKKYTGSQTTAPADLLAETAQVNANFIGKGIAYLYVRMEYDPDTFPNGVPLFTAIRSEEHTSDLQSLRHLV